MNGHELPRHYFCVCLMAVLACLLFTVPAKAETRVKDDNDDELALQQPARRIVSLAPHATELLFAAGAGEYLVGAVNYSDYPAAALSLPRVGDASHLDIEAIVALRPDLVVAWGSGNAQVQQQRLRSLGLTVYVSEPHSIEQMISSIERLGSLAGTTSEAQTLAKGLRERLADLRRRYSKREPVPVFFQVWDEPLMTLNGKHFVTDVIRLCGGQNVFADMTALVPQLSREAVLAMDPEVMLAAQVSGQQPLVSWQRWSFLQAVRRDNLYLVPADLINRPTPRLLEGAAQLCEWLEQARSKRR